MNNFNNPYRVLPFALSLIGHVLVVLTLEASVERACVDRRPMAVQVVVIVSNKHNTRDHYAHKREPQVLAEVQPKKRQKKALNVPSKNAIDFNRESYGIDKSIGEHVLAEQNMVTDKIVRKWPQLVNGNEVKVIYPKKARALNVEGVVRLRLRVSIDGEVTDARVLSGPAFGLRDAALVLVRKFFFLPATDDLGGPRDSEIEHEVIFKLTNQS